MQLTIFFSYTKGHRSISFIEVKLIKLKKNYVNLPSEINHKNEDIQEIKYHESVRSKARNC